MRLNRAALGWLLVASSLRVSALLPSCRELGGAARASQRGRAEALASAFEIAGRRSIETPAAADAWRARFPALGCGVFELQQQAVEAGLKLSAPQLVVLGARRATRSNELQLRWLLSATWPTAWALPRVALHGESDLPLGGGGTGGAGAGDAGGAGDSLAFLTGAPPLPPERWIEPRSAAALFTEQVVAPVSQLNVIFGQPECEAPSRRRLQAVGPTFGGPDDLIELRELLPRPALRVQAVDSSTSRTARTSAALPDCVFETLKKRETDSSSLRGVASFEIAIDGLERDDDDERGDDDTDQSTIERIVTWTTPLPSVFGLQHLANASAARLSATRAADGYDLSLDDGGGADGEALARLPAQLVATGQTLEFILEPRRTVLVAQFDGDNQDRRAADVKRALLEVARQNGLEIARTGQGRPRFNYHKNNAKLGFFEGGGLAVGIHPPPSAGGQMRPCEISLEVVDTKKRP